MADYYTRTNLAPTAEAIDEWRAKQPRTPKGYIDCHGEHYDAEIRTKAGTWRLIVGKGQCVNGERCYETITNTGKSSTGRRTLIRASDIAQARAIYMPVSEYRLRNPMPEDW